jgi:two-component system, OmpR family, phosphate regulon response regulator PhoB
MAMPSQILIVEDEQDLVSILEYNLQREGHMTKAVLNGTDALKAIQEDPAPDLVLLDLMLPDISGTEVCRQIRLAERTRRLPVIMLTAKGEEIDRVVGFEVGADDYVTKPFSVRELMLRVRAILRRFAGEEEAPVDTNFGRLRMDSDGHRVWVDEEEITLTALEFKLLHTFLARKGRVQSREQLLNDVWGINADVVTRTVDTHVKRLREKLGEAGKYIETLRGVGYRFRDHPDDESS